MAGESAMKQTKGPVILAILIMTVGVGLLLTARGVGPGINWVWTLGLAAVGVLSFVVSGRLDKVSVVVGPFLLVGSGLSVLRQRDVLSPDTEVPILVILVGALLLIAQHPTIPLPRWYEQQAMGGRK